MTNFDLIPDRRKNAMDIKWTRYPKDVLPMWVADMDFPAPTPILKTMQKVLERGVLGYEAAGDELKETVATRMDRLYGWKVKPNAVVTVTGIVSGFTIAARAFCSPQRGVLLQTPVYNEFHEIKHNVGIPQIDVPFIRNVSGNILSYEIDWELFEIKMKRAGMFLLCNPHNPLGIIFSPEELTRMAEICIRNKVLIVSDEIHSELLLGGSTFAPMARLSSEIARHTITLISPSKTFNIPGLFCGFAIIPNKEMRDRYVRELDHMRLHVSSMGLHATLTGFSGQCDGWLRKLCRYLTANRDFVTDYVTKYMPDVRLTIPEATYLGWLDFSRTNIKGSPFEFFKKNAKVALSDGKIFGREGKGHVRLNFGTSRELLKQGLDRMRKALKSVQM